MAIESDDVIGRRYERFAERLRAQDPAAAAEEFSRLCHWLRHSDLKVPERAISGFMEAWIDLFWQARRHDMMLRAADQSIELWGQDPIWAFARGEALFNLGRFDEARATLEPLTHEDFDEPMLYYLLACLAERRGEASAARRLFQTAHKLDSENFVVPQPVSESEAIAAYEQCLEELPTRIAVHLKEVPVFVSALPADDLIRAFDPPLDPLLMGVFMGNSRTEGESPWASDQPRIMLFHANIAKVAGDFETLEDELRKTLFHEVGHFLGFDEDELEEMGLA